MDQDHFELRFAALASALQPDEVADLLAACTPVEIAAGEVLITEGTSTSALHLVVDGELVVTVGDGVRARDVGVIGVGGLVGEVSLLDHGPASATVRSEVGAHLLELDHVSLAGFESAHPVGAAAFVRHVGATLAQRLRQVVRTLAEGESMGTADAVPVASPAEVDGLRELLEDLGEPASVTDDEAIVDAGARRDAVAVVLDGDVVVTGPAGDLAVLDRGAVLGAEALFGAVTSTTAIARGDATVARVDLVELEARRRVNPSAIARLERAAATQLARLLRIGNEAVGHRDVEEDGDDTDVAVIGAGPIGLAYAWFLRERSPSTRIVVLDRRDHPGYKVGESTLATTTRAFHHMGLSFPVMRRLFGVKAGIRFWWTEPGDDELHDHIDAVDIEETFQVERRVVETALVASARRRGIDVRMGERVLIGDSEIGRDGSRLAVNGPSGDYDLDARFVCDASGRAAVLPRRFGLLRSVPDRHGTFNTNSYYAYFRVRDEPDIPHWNEPATRHICFEQGWTWFITVLSWEGTPQENLEAMVEYLLDHPDGPDESYPSRRELEQRFEAQSELLVSVGFTIREDRDTSLGKSVAGRFNHYRERYPAVDEVLSHHDLVERPYGKRQPYSAFQRLVHDSAEVAGDGWCAVGDAAMFTNPLFSPGLNLGTGTAHEAAVDTARALAAGDTSARAFGSYQHYAERTYTSLMSLNDMLYRAFAHRTTYERALLMFFYHAAGDVFARDLYSDTDPYVWDLLNPEFTRRADEVRALLRAAENTDADPEQVVRDVLAVTDPYITEMGPKVEESGIDISVAIRNFDRLGHRAPRNQEPGDYAATRCETCDQWFDASLGNCIVCDATNPVVHS